MESLFLTRGHALSLWSGNTDTKIQDYQRTPNPGEYQIVRTHTKATMYTRPNITHLPVAPCAECLIQTANKTKIQTQHHQMRLPLHSALQSEEK